VNDGSSADWGSDSVWEVVSQLRLYPLALALVAGGKVSIAGDRTHGDAAITPGGRLIVPDEM